MQRSDGLKDGPKKHVEYVLPAVLGTCRKKTNASLAWLSTFILLYFLANDDINPGHESNLNASSMSIAWPLTHTASDSKQAKRILNSFIVFLEVYDNLTWHSRVSLSMSDEKHITLNLYYWILFLSF